jgi:hypothetical protein
MKKMVILLTHGSRWRFLLKCSSWSLSSQPPLHHDDNDNCPMVVWALQTGWVQEFMCCLMSSTMVIEKKHHRWEALHSSRFPTLWTLLMVHLAFNAKCTRLFNWWQSSLRMAITTTSTWRQSLRIQTYLHNTIKTQSDP